MTTTPGRVLPAGGPQTAVAPPAANGTGPATATANTTATATATAAAAAAAAAAIVSPGAPAAPGPQRSADAAATARTWRTLHGAATAPYRRSGRFAWHFARGKLGRDPVFRGLLERGDLPPQARIVDIGCGQGLLASLLQSCAELQARGQWPAAWPVSASASAYTGVELMPRDVARAQAAIGTLPLAPQLVCGDMCSAALPPCDVVVILDVLHYVDHAAQARLLAGVRDALRGGAATRHPATGAARLLLRVGDAASTRGFAVSQWVDRAVTRIRGHRVAPTWGRPLADWVLLLQGLGFAVRSVPMSQGTPFANVLLVADLATAGAAE
jgi:SAM-dependent methyltransferase